MCKAEDVARSIRANTWARCWVRSRPASWSMIGCGQVLPSSTPACEARSKARRPSAACQGGMIGQAKIVAKPDDGQPAGPYP